MANVAIVVTKKRWGSKEFSNTWAVMDGTEYLNTTLTEAALVRLMGDALGTQLDGQNTNPQDDNYLGEGSVIAAILGFERQMIAQPVIFTGVYISDGKTPGDGTGMFTTLSFSFPGLAPIINGEDVAPLNCVLQLNRVPAGLGRHAGRIQLRAALAKGDIAADSGDGVTFVTGRRAAIELRVRDAWLASELFNYTFAGGTAPVPETQLVIPQFIAPGLPNAGAIKGASRMLGVAVDEAAGRQTKRGKKRRKVGSVPA